MRLANSTYRTKRACHTRGTIGLGSSRKHRSNGPYRQRTERVRMRAKMYRGFFIQALQLSTTDWRYQVDGREITCPRSPRRHVRQIALRTADSW